MIFSLIRTLSFSDQVQKYVFRHISLIACTDKYIISELYLEVLTKHSVVGRYHCYLRLGAPLFGGHGGLRASRALSG